METTLNILALDLTPDGREALGDWYEDRGRLDVACLYRDQLPERAGPLRRRVTALTSAERERLEEHVKKWIAIGRCTKPADREKAEAALLACYRMVGLPTPRKLVWAKSPVEALSALVDVAAEMFESPDEARCGVATNMFYNRLTPPEVAHALHGDAYEEIYAAIGVVVRGAVDDAVRSPIDEAIEMYVDSLLRDASRDERWREYLSILWLHHLGAQLWVGLQWYGPACASYVLDVLNVDIGRYNELCARAYIALCESCCLVWPNKSFAVLCERPRVLEFRGDADNGPDWQELARAEWEGWEVLP